jgi:ribosomal protein S18 acetylase RimI-like enzyme
MKNAGAAYSYSEYEMYLCDEKYKQSEGSFPAVCLRKADNADAAEIARQNSIYFCEGEQDIDGTQKIHVLPEEEEKRGMTIYLAEKDNQAIGKVNLQLINALGGIYGLGVLPEERGKGYGRAILIKAIKTLKEAEAGEIMLQVAAENATALNLYKSCGFQETSVMDYYDIMSVN